MQVDDATSGIMHVFCMDLLSLLDSCRICMARNINMITIFDRTNSKNIIEEIMFCTGITITQEDKLPRKICSQCLKDLSVAYKFKTSCLLADQTFRKLTIDSNLKCEQTAISDAEFDDTITYKDEQGDYVNDKVENEPKLEPVAVQDTSNQKDGTRAGRMKSTDTNKCLGRSKKSNAPRRMKKFKFKKLHCESCDIKFDNKQQCDQHKKDIHKDSEHWVCEICGKLFVHRASHYTHIKSHMPPKYACDQCDYKTWHKYDLVKHIRRHTGIKMYQCEYCTASYYTSSNLTGHIRRNHMKEKPFPCHLCRMSFFDKTKLNRHIDSHNEIKRFECEVCHSCFTRRCYWKKHLLRQHDIITPPQRPGRQKINAVVGEYLLEKVNTYIRPGLNVNTDAKKEELKINSVLTEDLCEKVDSSIRPTAKINMDSVAEFLIQKTAEL